MSFLTLMSWHQEDGLGDLSVSLPQPRLSTRDQSPLQTFPPKSTPTFPFLALPVCEKKFHTQIDTLKKRRFSYSWVYVRNEPWRTLKLHAFPGCHRISLRSNKIELAWVPCSPEKIATARFAHKRVRKRDEAVYTWFSQVFRNRFFQSLMPDKTAFVSVSCMHNLLFKNSFVNIM